MGIKNHHSVNKCQKTGEGAYQPPPPPVAVVMCKGSLYISRNVWESLKKQKNLQILNRQKLDFGIGGGTNHNPD